MAADQLKWLHDLAGRVVDFCWLAPKKEEIDMVATIAKNDDGSQKKYPFCHCREGKEMLTQKVQLCVVVKSWFNKLNSVPFGGSFTLVLK